MKARQIDRHHGDYERKESGYELDMGQFTNSLGPKPPCFIRNNAEQGYLIDNV
jgi:hypothetical protein